MRFAHVQRAFRDAGFAVPDSPFTIKDGSPAVGVFMVPGKDKTGNLEMLLSEVVFEAHPDFKPCLDAFSACLRSTDGWDENKKAKMWLNTAIAAYCDEDPSAALSRVWGKHGNPIPLGSPRFNELLDFFRSVSGR